MAGPAGRSTPLPVWSGASRATWTQLASFSTSPARSPTSRDPATRVAARVIVNSGRTAVGQRRGSRGGCASTGSSRSTSAETTDAAFRHEAQRPLYPRHSQTSA
jgi:hypothetical protein